MTCARRFACMCTISQMLHRLKNLLTKIQGDILLQFNNLTKRHADFVLLSGANMSMLVCYCLLGARMSRLNQPEFGEDKHGFPTAKPNAMAHGQTSGKYYEHYD